jgi:hypothetical protein
MHQFVRYAKRFLIAQSADLPIQRKLRALIMCKAGLDVGRNHKCPMKNDLIRNKLL